MQLKCLTRAYFWKSEMPFFILNAQHKDIFLKIALHNKNGPVLEISNAYSAHGVENRLYWSSTFEIKFGVKPAFLHCAATCMKITAQQMKRCLWSDHQTLKASVSIVSERLCPPRQIEEHLTLIWPALEREDMFIALRISSVHVFARQVILKNIFLAFPISYENVICECSLKLPFFKKN